MTLLFCGLPKVFGFHQFTNQLNRKQKQISNVYNYLKMTALNPEDFTANNRKIEAYVGPEAAFEEMDAGYGIEDIGTI